MVDVTSYPHEAVLIVTFEVLVRYASAIPKKQDAAVKNLLMAFLGDRFVFSLLFSSLSSLSISLFSLSLFLL